MKKLNYSIAIIFSLIGTLVFLNSSLLLAQRQMENLSRALVAVKVSNGVFLSWRILGTEFADNSYNIYRNGVKIATIANTGASNYLDASGTSTSVYTISRSLPNGWEGAQSASATPWADIYKTIPLSVPAGVKTPDGVTCTYSPNDCSVGDLDGDGDYEIVVKWDPSNSKDNSQSGYTGNVYLDAYEMDGTRKWRIDLGINIRAGAHYTQFIVYDLNGDGKAEVAFKGAPGTKGNNGTVIGGTTDYRNSSGYILSGAEYLCIASGASGNILSYISYNPPRGTVSSWGDSYGNRVDRFLAGVAYLNGTTPSLIMCRGYYTRSVIVAYDYTGNTLTQKWAFDSNNSGYSGYAGQGNHNLSIGDIDSDGYDEIVYGACAIDHNGAGKYTTGWGHGDAMHLGDLNPDKSGLEVWQCHEGGSGATFRNAGTGSQYWKYSNTGDVGRALSADINSSYKGEECWASGSSLYSCTGTNLGTAPGHCNFAIWWDGDLSRELLDGDKLDKWNGSGLTRLVTLYNIASSTYCNGTKKNPNLQADILGDWREEIILHSSDNTKLVIFTTTATTSTRMYTLMHDKMYRLGAAWQNVAYNQPPHLSFYFGNGMGTIASPSVTLKSGKPISVEEAKAEEAKNHNKNFNISPNPVAYGTTEITLGLSEASDVKVYIYNITGKEVKLINLGVRSGIVIEKLDLSSLYKGTYIIKVLTTEGEKTAKIVKL